MIIPLWLSGRILPNRRKAVREKELLPGAAAAGAEDGGDRDVWLADRP